MLGEGMKGIVASERIGIDVALIWVFCVAILLLATAFSRKKVIKRKFLNLLLITVCTFWMWWTFERAHIYEIRRWQMKTNEMRVEIRNLENEIVFARRRLLPLYSKKLPTDKELPTDEDVKDLIDELLRELRMMEKEGFPIPHLSIIPAVFFRSLPIVAFMVGIYLLFLRKKEQGE